MKASKFYQKFTNEQVCRNYLRDLRISQGVTCRKCGHDQHYWKSDKEQFQCKKCQHRTGLKCGTVMENSNLPVSVWFEAMFLMLQTRKAMSAREMRRQLGLKRYEPVWYLMHKIRQLMSHQNMDQVLKGEIEFDDAFFTIVRDQADDEEESKRGRGSQRKQAVMVMVEAEAPPEGKTKGRCGHLQMFAVSHVDGDTVQELENFAWEPGTRVKTDGYSSYKKLNSKWHQQFTVPAHLADKILPWVHIAISNAKRLINGIYHHVHERYLQLYLDEFSYKFNSRHERDAFSKLLQNAVLPLWV